MELLAFKELTCGINPATSIAIDVNVFDLCTSALYFEIKQKLEVQGLSIIGADFLEQVQVANTEEDFVSVASRFVSLRHNDMSNLETRWLKRMSTYGLVMKRLIETRRSLSEKTYKAATSFLRVCKAALSFFRVYKAAASFLRICKATGNLLRHNGLNVFIWTLILVCLAAVSVPFYRNIKNGNVALHNAEMAEKYWNSLASMPLNVGDQEGMVATFKDGERQIKIEKENLFPGFQVYKVAAELGVCSSINTRSIGVDLPIMLPVSKDFLPDASIFCIAAENGDLSIVSRLDILSPIKRF